MLADNAEANSIEADHVRLGGLGLWPLFSLLCFGDLNKIRATMRSPLLSLRERPRVTDGAAFLLEMSDLGPTPRDPPGFCIEN